MASPYHSHDDDFFLPRHTDVNEPCASDSNIAQGDVVLPIGAALSMVCYLYLIWMYFVLQSPVFGRHPTTLAVYKCVIELIFIQQYLWVPSIDNQKFFDDDHDMAPYKCSSSAYAGYLAFITQFALVGSELCFFIISYDLRLAYTNPFSSFKENRWWFFSLVVGWSTISAFALIFMGPRVYGMSDLGLVWIQKRREEHSPNYPKAVLYYIVTVAVFVYSLWANFQFNLDSGKGFSKTVSNRLSIMKRSKRFTVGYVGYGCLVFLMEFISYVSHSKSPVLNNAPAYLLAFRGVWGMGVILYSNYQELTWELLNPFRLRLQPQEGMKEDVAMEKLLLQPHLNTALRAEILYFTTQGIMFAAKDYHRRTLARRSARQGQPQHHTEGGMRSPRDDEDTEGEDTEFSVNEGSGANIRLKDDAPAAKVGVKNNTPGSRYSLGSLYPRRSTPQGAAPNRHTSTASSTITASSSQQSLDDGFDLNGMDMFTRNSIAIFERLNKEQSDAVSKEMEAAIIDETTPLGLTKRKGDSTKVQEGGLRHSIGASTAATAGYRSYNPFQTQGLGTRNPLQRSISIDRGVEMKPAGISAVVRSGDADVEAPAEEEERHTEVVRESEALDVEFGMHSQSAGAQDRQSARIASMPLWRRIETPPPDLQRTLSTNSERSESTESSHGNDPAGRRSSRASVISKVLMGALVQASDAAKTLFGSSQFKEFRFKDFCPKLFGKVRELSGIDNEEYAKYFEKTCKEKFSEGRSGAFMFFSSNEKFIVKTTTKSESLALHGIMPQYVAHLKKNPNSLVCRFLGAHCITMYGNELYFVVMLNVFPTFPLSERYDLKGSWVNRHGFEFSRKSKRERMRREPTSSSPLYQDNDLQHKISLELDVTFALASQIRRDVMFLRGLQLMDYSLLIGVRRERFKVLDGNNNAGDGVDRASRMSVQRDTDVVPMEHHSSVIARPGSSSVVARPLGVVDETTRQDAFKRDLDGGMRARLVEGPGTYYVGIIDVLQEWNWNKKIERFLKIYFKRYDPDGISAIEPNAYSERFWRGAVLDTFDGLEYDTEELLHWKGDESGGLPPEPRETNY